MATLSQLTATQAGTVASGTAAFTAHLQDIVTLGVLQGNRINSVHGLVPYLETALGAGLSAALLTARAAGDVVRESAE